MKYVFACCLFSFFISLSSHAQGGAVRAERPSIFRIKPKASDHDIIWETYKKAQIVFVAQLLEFYPPKSKLYFLARDGEYLFDLAQLVTKGTSDYERIKLLNVSSINMEDANLINYLNQNGLTEQSLMKGDAILVDTCCRGSIKDKIQMLFSDEVKDSIKLQLIISKSGEDPSSRAFLSNANLSFDLGLYSSRDRQILSRQIIEYEKLEKYNDRSTHFKLIGKKYYPMSESFIPKKDKKMSKEDKISQDHDIHENAHVSKIKNTKRRADLRAYWLGPEVQDELKSIREDLRAIRKAFLTGEEKYVQSLKKQLSDLSHTNEYELLEAHIRDAYDILANQNYKIKISLPDLGLSDGNQKPEQSFVSRVSNEEPAQVNVQKLFSQKKWDEIVAILKSEKINYELYQSVIEKLYKKKIVHEELARIQIEFFVNGFERLKLNSSEPDRSYAVVPFLNYLLKKGRGQLLSNIAFLGSPMADAASAESTDAFFTELAQADSQAMEILKSLQADGGPVSSGCEEALL